MVLALGCLSSLASAQPYGYSVNSRGFLPDDQMHLLWRVNLGTGATEAIGPTGFLDMEGLAFSADGTLYGADDESKTLVTVNLNSGFSAPVGGVRTNMDLPLQEMDFGMTFTCTDDLLVVSDIRQSLFRANRESATLELLGSEGSLGAPITGIAAWGSTIYGIGQGATVSQDSVQPLAPNLYRINLQTATAELIGPLGSSVDPYTNAGLAFDSEGRLWAVTDRREPGRPALFSQVLEINPENGQAVSVINTDVVGFEPLAIAPPGGCNLADAGAIPQIPVNHPLALMLLAASLLFVAGWTLRARAR